MVSCLMRKLYTICKFSWWQGNTYLANVLSGIIIFWFLQIEMMLLLANVVSKCFLVIQFFCFHFISHDIYTGHQISIASINRERKNYNQLIQFNIELIVKSCYRQKMFIKCIMLSLDSGDLLLASCSKDCSIRIWRISSSSQNTKHCTNENKAPLTVGDLIEDELKLTSNLFTINYQGT